MAGELSAGAKIGRTKLIAADVSGTETAFKRDRKPGAAQFEARSKGTDEGVITVLAKPTGGKVDSGLQVPIGAEIPAPQIVIEECFGLSEMLAGVFGWEPQASTDGLEPEFLLLLLSLGGERKCASEQD